MLWLLDGPAPLRGNGRTRGATGTGFFLLDPIRSLSTFSCFAFRNGLRCSDVLRRYTAPMGGNERIPCARRAPSLCAIFRDLDAAAS